jgi:NAD+ synthase (glutamine-hydrolysing)
MRHFTAGGDSVEEIVYAGQSCLFGKNILFCCETIKNLVVAAEICEDVWVQTPPSITHCAAGATVIVNLSASPEAIGKAEYRADLVRIHSARLACGYVYAAAGEYESTTDLVYSGHSLVAENGVILAERQPFTEQRLVVTELDIERLAHDRRRLTDFKCENNAKYRRVAFSTRLRETELTRSFERNPFVPSDSGKRDQRCALILDMQASALAKRQRHTNSKTAVIGVSGGLDSTLALLAAVRAFDRIGKPRSDILAITMPCFGTGTRTRGNAEKLCERLGTGFECICIEEAVRRHLEDISHNSETYDVTYENAQARERTQVLMDMANKTGGIVVGTGDLSEMALGWSTYNGDHMSMYAVNCSVPKTLVRYVVGYYADITPDKALAEVLRDILDTPVSPELIPSASGELGQRTEEILGTYELHDFFLYYCVRFGYPPDKIMRIAEYTFVGVYEKDYIGKVLRTFYTRFFAQQFKRSCTPDGVKVGSVALSPRGDWRMPSDASVSAWLDRLD